MMYLDTNNQQIIVDNHYYEYVDNNSGLYDMKYADALAMFESSKSDKYILVHTPDYGIKYSAYRISDAILKFNDGGILVVEMFTPNKDRPSSITCLSRKEILNPEILDKVVEDSEKAMDAIFSMFGDYDSGTQQAMARGLYYRLNDPEKVMLLAKMQIF